MNGPSPSNFPQGGDNVAQEKIDEQLAKIRARAEYKRGVDARNKEVRRFGIDITGQAVYPDVLRPHTNITKKKKKALGVKKTQSNAHSTLNPPKGPAIPPPTEVDQQELKRTEDGTWVQANFF